MDKKQIIEQTKLAFSFIQKMYLEASYLIKEIEAQLSEEEEIFIIGKPSGYGINTRGSTGLEPMYVNLWQIRKFGVFFVPMELTKANGTTTTKFSKDTKVIYVRIILDDEDIKEPAIYFGVLFNFGQNTELKKKFTKVEHLISLLEYRDKAIFDKTENIEYEDGYIKFSGKLHKANLLDINGSEEVYSLIVTPALKLYRDL